MKIVKEGLVLSIGFAFVVTTEMSRLSSIR
jgi:hypothetical protein